MRLQCQMTKGQLCEVRIHLERQQSSLQESKCEFSHRTWIDRLHRHAPQLQRALQLRYLQFLSKKLAMELTFSKTRILKKLDRCGPKLTPERIKWKTSVFQWTKRAKTVCLGPWPCNLTCPLPSPFWTSKTKMRFCIANQQTIFKCFRGKSKEIDQLSFLKLTSSLMKLKSNLNRETVFSLVSKKTNLCITAKPRPIRTKMI